MRRLAAAAALVVLGLAGCGSDGDEQRTTERVPGGVGRAPAVLGDCARQRQQRSSSELDDAVRRQLGADGKQPLPQDLNKKAC